MTGWLRIWGLCGSFVCITIYFLWFINDHLILYGKFWSNHLAYVCFWAENLTLRSDSHCFSIHFLRVALDFYVCLSGGGWPGKSVALEELEKTLRQQHEQTELSYSDKMSQLNVQLQQLDTVVSQVQHTINWSTIHTANENSQLSVTNLNI